MNSAKAKLIVALDVDTFDEARSLVDKLSDVVDIFKVGIQLFTSSGPSIVFYILDKGKDVFLDLKFHDIPNTVANAVKAVVNLNQISNVEVSGGKSKKKKRGNIVLCTLHVMGGEEMLKKAVESVTAQAEKIQAVKPALVGITVLTSDAQTDNIQAIILERARLAKTCGLDGVVASGQEASLIRREMGDNFIIVTPGIRPSGADVGDQKRVVTPSLAIKEGSNYLVVGRPVVKAMDPHVVAFEILNEMKKAN